MRHDVASDGLLRVYSVSHTTTWIRRHLISDEDCNVELLRNFLQSAHDLVQDLLALSKLTTPTVVHPEGCHY